LQTLSIRGTRLFTGNTTKQIETLRQTLNSFFDLLGNFQDTSVMLLVAFKTHRDFFQLKVCACIKKSVKIFNISFCLYGLTNSELVMRIYAAKSSV
jgi:hypothetical protein